jgi:hypothetical protein
VTLVLKRASASRPSGEWNDDDFDVLADGGARDALRELRAAVLARQQAEAELAALYRERAIIRARAAERDPTLPLQ